MINSFTNDTAYISTRWLLRLVAGRGHVVRQLLRVTHRGLHTVHMVALLDDHSYLCDCGMGTNLGIPCRHYFQVLSVVKNLKFNLKVVRARCATYFNVIKHFSNHRYLDKDGCRSLQSMYSPYR